MSLHSMDEMLFRSETSELERITPDSLDNAINLCAAAFMTDPLYVTAAPDAEGRKRLVRSLTELFLRYGMRFGMTYRTSGPFDGLAVWLSPEERDIAWGKAIRIGALKLPFRTRPSDLLRLVAVDNIATCVHIKDVPDPHWYLLMLAVAPEKRGRGIASKLMKPFLAALEERGESAYLETQNPDNVGIYRHFGFELLGDYAVPQLPGLRHFSMFRPTHVHDW